ncbi:MAG: restriction endonuclease [Methylococcales bacterium]|nr:restriction endonuclease [Methylococcales bacterium]
MFNLKEQTIREYSKISEIPLNQVLKVLENSGHKCNANDFVDPNMRRQLSVFFRKTKIPKTPKKTEEEKAILKEKKEILKNAIEIEKIRLEKAIQYRKKKNIAISEQIESELIASFEDTKPNIIKVSKIIDLCSELIPAAIAERIRVEYNYQAFYRDADDQLLSEIFLNNFYDRWECYIVANKEYCAYTGERYNSHSYINKNDAENLRLSLKITNLNLRRHSFFKIPKWIIDDHKLPCIMANGNSTFYYLNGDINCNRNTFRLCEEIKLKKKSKSYSSALVVIICSFLNFLFVDTDFKHDEFIGDLLIEMGAIDSALKLYNIDERIFNSSNSLSLLAEKAVQFGKLDEANQLIAKLIGQEPYHPAISNLQAEIKRLEQRHQLKTNFSIDFSEMNELSGVAFENLLLDKFVSLGFKAESTPKSGDFGADLIVENNEGTRIIVQCKRFKSKVNLQAVQEVVGAMGHYAGDMGIVITNNSFLNSAVKLAESHDIELWDGDKLVSFLAGDLSFSEVMGTVE